MASRDLSDWFSRRFDELAHQPLAPVEVSVLDSGIDSSHPDLADRIVESVSVQIVDGLPRIERREPGKNNDVYGHGTAVASIICSLIRYGVQPRLNEGKKGSLCAKYRRFVHPPDARCLE